jgi:uncharacterized membrane protein
MVMMETDSEYEEEARPETSRMVVAVAALIGLLIAIYTLMFKLGLVGSLACGTGGCETVQTSPWATQLGIPVPVWGVAGYGAMLVIALLGLQAKAHARWVPVLLLLGGTFGLIFSGYLTYLEAYRIGAWCRWCLVSAAVATVMFLAVLPELRRLRSTS